MLYSGRVAFTWKTAFDADFAKFSPGMLLVDRLSDHLLADGEVEKIDSCSPEKSFMAQLWTGRQTMVDLLVDLNPRASTTFQVACLGEAARKRIKSARDRWRSQGWPSAMRRRPEPATS